MPLIEHDLSVKEARSLARREHQKGGGVTVLLHPAHYQSITSKNLHFFRRENTSHDIVAHFLAQSASENNIFLGVLDGNNIRNSLDLLSQLWKVLLFPDADGGRNYNWDSASDWFGDLSWLKSFSGVILLYIEPLALFENQADIIGLLLDIVGNKSINHMSNGFSFHFVAGPTDLRIINFLNILNIRQHLCTECLYGE